MSGLTAGPTLTLPLSLCSKERGTTASRFVVAVGPGTTIGSTHHVVASLSSRQRGEGKGGPFSSLPRRRGF